MPFNGSILSADSLVVALHDLRKSEVIDLIIDYARNEVGKDATKDSLAKAIQKHIDVVLVPRMYNRFNLPRVVERIRAYKKQLERFK